MPQQGSRALAQAAMAQNLGRVQQSQNAALNQWTGTHIPWPYYRQPNYTVWTYPPPPTDRYANEVTVELGEHDATLIFKRKQGADHSEVARVTIPKPLGEAMAKQFAAKKRSR